MKPVKKIGLLLLVLNVTSCGGKTTSTPIGDLSFIKSSTTLGTGIKASGNANSFINCVSPTLLSWLPEKMKKWTIAFGINAPSSCGSCLPQFTCKSGETITLSSSLNSTTFNSTPNDFDADTGNVNSMGSRTVTCPSDGVFTESISFSGINAMKITFSSASGSDTEYLKCQLPPVK